MTTHKITHHDTTKHSEGHCITQKGTTKHDRTQIPQIQSAELHNRTHHHMQLQRHQHNTNKFRQGPFVWAIPRPNRICRLNSYKIDSTNLMSIQQRKLRSDSTSQSTAEWLKYDIMHHKHTRMNLNTTWHIRMKLKHRQTQHNTSWQTKPLHNTSEQIKACQPQYNTT